VWPGLGVHRDAQAPDPVASCLDTASAVHIRAGTPFVHHSPEVSILQTLNLDETRNDPWNPAPRCRALFRASLRLRRPAVPNGCKRNRLHPPGARGRSFLWVLRGLPFPPPPRGRDADGQYRACAFSTSTTSCIAGTAARTA